MAHFAQIDESNVVIDIQVVGNDNTADEEGNEVEAIGVAFLKETFGEDTNWVQTSYNTKVGIHALGGTPFRGTYAGEGMTYDPVLDVFLAPQPWPSFVLNEETFLWEPPIPIEPGMDWDEDTTSFVKPPSPFPSWVWVTDIEGQPPDWQPPTPYPDGEMKPPFYNWDEDTTAWVEVE